MLPITLADVPTHLNGYPVIMSTVSRRAVTVLVDRSTSDDHIKFVVATWWPELGTSWSWGYYFSDRKEADRAFVEVLRRNEQR